MTDNHSQAKTNANNQADAEKDFATLLNESPHEVGIMDFELGQTVEGPIVQIGNEFAYINLGAKGEAYIAIAELKNPENGKLIQAVGDIVKAKIVRFSKDGVLLSKASHAVGNIELEEAFAAGTPVKAKVVGTNKAGLECEVMGKKAFCPASQIDIHRVEDFTPYIGNSYEFKIIKYERHNMVLSRADLLRAQNQAQRETFLEQLTVGQQYDASVMRMEPFGAFLRLHDSGALEGMVHISELSYEKVNKVEDVLKIGQDVRVVVIDIKPNTKDKKRGPRLALSIKQLTSDPFDEAIATLRVGQRFTGKVTKMLKFGAIVQIMPGVTGLLHHSEYSWNRNERLERNVSPDDEIEVSIIGIDIEERRISLSSKQLQTDPWDTITNLLTPGDDVEGTVESTVEFGAFVSLPQGVTALLPLSEMPNRTAIRGMKPGDKIQAKCIAIDASRKRMTLSQKEDAEIQSDETADAPKPNAKNAKSRRNARQSEDRATYTEQSGFGNLGDIFGKLKND